ncbi:MAG: tetratricopeptide repeat protein [Deltaproteobacteria bacterium]|nr:tetratricopeptide repeat protein [Deltaproteobacteria bacterium]
MAGPFVPIAHAAEDDRARELFENGKRLYDEGLYKDAVAAWQAAYDLSPDRHLLLFNIANAFERLGRYQEALDHLNRYRALAPADERETLERRMRSIERRMQELKDRASSEPEGDPLLDTSGSQITVKSTSGGGGGGAITGPHPAGIALIAGGGAGLAIGGVFGGLALRERASAQALCVDIASGDTLCSSDAKTHIDSDRSFSLGSDIALIAGGVALGAGVIILVVDATSGGKTAGLQVIPSGGPSGASVTLRGRF